MQINILNLITDIYNRASIYKAFAGLQTKVNLLLDPHYGQRSISGNATVIAVTAAVDLTLSTNSDYVKITGIWDAAPSGQVNGITQQTNSFTVVRKGVYNVAVWVCVTSSANNTNVAFRFAKNDAITLVRRPRTLVAAAHDRKTIAAHGFVELEPDDVLTLWVASDKTADITVEDCVFSAEQMKALD